MASAERASQAEAAHRNTIAESDARGTIAIAPNVLLELIELTVRNVDGLVGLAGSGRKSRGRMLPIQDAADHEPKGKSYHRGGVRVRIDGDQIETDIAVVIRSGTHVPRLGQAIQERISVAVERMLGMTATEVNVHVAEIAPEGSPQNDGNQ